MFEHKLIDVVILGCLVVLLFASWYIVHVLGPVTGGGLLVLLTLLGLYLGFKLFDILRGK